MKTIIRFIACFAPAVAMFVLTLEWACPSPFKAPPTLAAHSNTHRKYCASHSVNGNTGAGQNIASSFNPFSERNFSFSNFNQRLISLNPFQSVIIQSQTTRSGHVSRQKARATSETLSFDDRLTRSAWVTIGLGLVTLTGGFGILLFQNRLR